MRLGWLCGVFLAALPLRGQETPADPPKKEPGTSASAPVEVTPETEKAIGRALDFLASKQGRNGALSSSYPAVVTSVGGLAFLASGSTPHVGPYAANIRGCLKYLRSICGRSGFVNDAGTSGMYGHGYTTQFFAEVLGMLRSEEEIDLTRQALVRAVHLLQRSQNRYGGWNSSPDGALTDDGSGAIAIMQITALRAARNAGIRVDQRTIDRARKYLGEMTSAEGWYAYNYGSRNGAHRSSALTGAGMYMMGAMDLHTDPRYDKGIRNLMAHAPFLNGKPAAGGSDWNDGWWHYTAFYASLAIYQHGGGEWTRWYTGMRDELLRRQAKDGSWPGDGYGGLNSGYSVLVLQLPYRYLPMFQEGGRGREGS